MNTLSWLLYAGDVADNLDWFFWLLMFFSVATGILWVSVGLAAAEDKESDEAFWRGWRKVGTWVIAPAFVMGVILGSFVPSKNTVYAIAASEMGERALTTPAAGKAFKALDAWLDKQIAPEPATETVKKDED